MLFHDILWEKICVDLSASFVIDCPDASSMSPDQRKVRGSITTYLHEYNAVSGPSVGTLGYIKMLLDLRKYGLGLTSWLLQWTPMVI